MDRSCRLLYGQLRPFEWNYFPLLTGRILPSNKKKKFEKIFNSFFLNHFPKEKRNLADPLHYKYLLYSIHKWYNFRGHHYYHHHQTAIIQYITYVSLLFATSSRREIIIAPKQLHAAIRKCHSYHNIVVVVCCWSFVFKDMAVVNTNNMCWNPVRRLYLHIQANDKTLTFINTRTLKTYGIFQL